MKSLLLKLGHKKSIILLGVLFIVNIALFSLPGLPANISKVTQEAPKAQIPDMQFAYSANDVYDFLTFIGAEGRQAYQRMHLTTDLTFPIIYGLFFFSVSGYLLLQVASTQYYFALIGLLAAGFDLAENFTLLYITTRYPKFLPFFANLARIFTIGKFSFIFISVLMIGFLSTKIIRRSSIKADRKMQR